MRASDAAKYAKKLADDLQAQLNQFTPVVLSVGDPVDPIPGVVYGVIPVDEMPVTDYLFRFDASELDLTDGASVDEWPDLSGNGNDVKQTLEEYKPTFLATGLNGKPTVEFAGDFLMKGTGFAFDKVDAFTFFAATDATASSGRSTTLITIGNETLSASSFRIRHSGSQGEFSATINDNSGSAVSVPRIDNPALYTAVYNGTSYTLYSTEDAGSTVNFSEALLQNDRLVLGGRETGGEAYYGRISEIIYFSRALTEHEINDVTAYLNSKWGI